MRIALINPNAIFRPGAHLAQDPALDAIVLPFARSMRKYTPSDSLLALAAMTPRGHECVYMDDQFGSVDTEAAVDLAAITSVTMHVDRAYAIAEAFRRRGVPVVMGGIHATMLPDEALAHADTVITGDADNVWKPYLADLRRGRAKRRYDGGRADIRKAPLLKRSILPRSSFVLASFGKEVYTLRSSSGCTRRCKFCANWQKQGCDRFRTKSMRQVERELAAIASQGGDAYLNLTDDNLFLDLDHATKVIERIRDVGIPWFAGGDVAIARHPKLLRLLKESRCQLICMGFESLNAQNLAWLAPWKARQVPHYREAVRRLRDNGLNAMGSFIVGLEHDGPGVVRECYDFFEETKLFAESIAILAPLPGTLARERLLKEGRIDLSLPWSAYSSYTLVYRHNRLSREHLSGELRWFYEQILSPAVRDRIRSEAFE